MPALTSIVDSRLVKAVVCAADENLFPLLPAGGALLEMPAGPNASRPGAAGGSGAQRPRLGLDRGVLEALGRLSEDFQVAVVSRAGRSRLDVCLAATGLGVMIPPERRFCPDGEPGDDRTAADPATYRRVCELLGVDPTCAVAVEPRHGGVRAACAAGLRPIGNLHFVEPRERGARAVELSRSGAVVVVRGWATVARLLRCFP